MDRQILAGCTVVAAIATVGSLYFSEVAGFPPCELCWYQRILVYPLVVVFGVATIERRPGVWRSALPLSVLGVVVAGYHSILQLSPDITCSAGSACTTVYWRGLGFLTIPRLSLFAFLGLIAGSLALAWLDRWTSADDGTSGQ